jgi:hypothetical protein
MAEEFEDPIEAIKRRNEERARRLKERIASGEFDRFETPLEEVDESLPTGPGAIEAPESDFDLSSFPAPPEPSAISFDEEREAPSPEAPPEAPPEFAPPPAAEGGEPEFAAPPEGAEEPEFAPPEEEVPEAAPPPAFEPVMEAVSGMDLTELDLEGVGGFVAPEPWEAEVPAPPPMEAVPPASEEAPPVEVPSDLEIEVEPVAAAPAEKEAAPVMEEEEVVAAAAEIGEPTLGEEEAEAIKATIEEELREIPPAAPPMPPRPEEVPVGYEAEAEIAAPAARGPSEIFIGIEVEGNKVRIERRNITLAATVDLFRSIIDRYQNK